MAGQYGKTWWGEQWLAAFNGIDYSNRLPRGRRYAGNGSVTRIAVNDQGVSADVQGRRRTPYKVSVRLKAFSTKAQKDILQAISQNPAVLARLLNRQLPEQTLELLNQNKIAIFPSKWSELSASCSCPDWAMPCKHIAAVIYLIANEIDKNPFLVFQLKGMDLAASIEKVSGLAMDAFEGIPRTIDSWQPEPVMMDWQIPDHEVFEGMDLATIKPLDERIFSILSPKPLFHDKDFRALMANVYKRTAKQALAIDKVSDIAARDNSEDSALIDVSELNQLTLVVSEDGHFLETLSDNTLFVVKKKEDWVYLLGCLRNTQQPEVSRRFHHAMMWLHLYRLALKLVVSQAYVPAVNVQSQEKTVITWQPALLSDEVKAQVEPLYSLCPPDLVNISYVPKGKRKAITAFAGGKEQVNLALHSLISFFTKEGLQQAPDNISQDYLAQLFFAGYPICFNDFETIEYPRVMRQWLHRLYLGERQHRLHLVVDELADERLSVDISVESKGRLQPLAALFSDDTLSETKVNALTDLALLADYFPEIEQLYQGQQSRKRASQLCYSLAEFTPILMNTLPALTMLGIQLVLPKALRNLAYPKLSLSLKGSKDTSAVSYLNLDQLLNFNWQVAVGDKRVSAKEFMQLVENASGLVKMLGQYVLLEDSKLKQLLKKLHDLPESLSRVQLLKAGLSGELDGAQVDLGDSAKALFDQLLSSAPTPIPEGLKAELRPYQQRGFEWMAQNSRIGFGSLLADDMGLGKTLQVITLLLHQKEAGQLADKKALVIAPTSLLTNWRKEIERFAPALSVQVYHGNQRQLKDQSHDIILTSYGLVRSDNATLSKPGWRTVVIDEAQAIKNPGSQQTKAVKKLKADIRIGMSGTPVENRLREYWSVFDFSNKSYLGTQKKFQEEYATPIEKDRDQASLQRFRKITAPFILRRLKTDKSIISDLPEKVESNRYCQLSKEQASLYQSTVDTIMEELNSAEEGIERKGVIFKLLNALKQICNAPSQYLKRDQPVEGESGKLSTFMEIMREATEVGEKVLVFTQYTTMGDLLAGSIRKTLGIEAPFLHGGLSRKKRDQLVDDFQNNPRCQVMILSLKAGGTGLNLTAASQVIHYDLWWNPAVEAQATDRAYRIGQKKNVQVHRLITEKTFEEKIDAMIQSKKELADLTVASGEQWLTEMSDKDIRELVSL